MQIHEVFGFGKEPIPVTGTAAFGQKLKATGKAMQQDPKSLIDPHRAGRAKQAGYAAAAARSAQDLIDKGYGKVPGITAPTANQTISQVRNDAAAQQLINNWASQWVAMTSSQSGQQPVTEQTNSDYLDTFVKWADQVVERTTRMTGAINRIKQKPEWKQQFDNAAAEVVRTAGDAQQNQKAVQAYLTIAVAAARAEHEDRDTSVSSRVGTAAGITDPQAAELARAVGLDADDLTELKQHITLRNRETVNPNLKTGSPSLDALLRAAKLIN